MVLLSFVFILTSRAEAIQVFDKEDNILLENPQFKILSSTSDAIVLDVKIPEMEVESVLEEGQIYQKLYIPGCGYLDHIGKPMLPSVSTYLSIPEKVDISIEELEVDSVIFESYNVYPVQEHLPDTNDEEYSFYKDVYAYSEDKFYPEENIALREPFIMRGERVLMFSVYPVKFNAAKQQLIVIDNIRVRINFSRTSSMKRSLGIKTESLRLKSKPSKDAFNPIFENFILNYEPGVKTYSRKASVNLMDKAAFSSDGADYLIITHDHLYDTILPLEEQKRAKGLKVRVTRTSEIASGDATADEIAQYIQEAYDTWSPVPTYILLVGDTNLIPIHKGNQVPSDLYYATVDGDDYFPDIFIGRLPARTTSELDVMVNKIIDYETNFNPYDPWRNRVLLAAHKESGRYFVDTSESNRIFLESEGYDCTTVYTGGSYSGTTRQVIDAINHGCFIVNHRDHGMPSGWGHPRFTVSDVPSLNNTGGELPIMFSINCSSGRFDSDSDCFGESLLKAHNDNGATGVAAFIGAIRVSYSGYNDELDKGFFACMWPHYYLGYANRVENSDKMGAILNFAKFFMYDKYVLTNGQGYGWTPSPSTTEMEFELFHLLGDPEMSILMNGDIRIHARITSPFYGDFVHGVKDIEGSACIEDDFSTYELYFFSKEDPQEIIYITDPANPPYGNVVDDVLWTWDTTGYDDGEHTIVLKLTDANGMEILRSVDVAIDNINTEPVFTNLSNKTSFPHRPIEFTVEAFDPDDPETPAGQLIYSVSEAWSSFFDPETQDFSWTPCEDDIGVHRVSFRVTDCEGLSYVQEITLSVMYLPPSIQLTDDTDNQYDPAIYEDKIVWEDWKNGNRNIYLRTYDSVTDEMGPEVQLTTDARFQYDPAIYEDKIVWMDYERYGNGNFNIYLCTYDSMTGEIGPEVQLTTDTHSQFDPAIYDDKIVWRDYERSVDSNIHLRTYDSATGEMGPEIQITTDPESQIRPAIYEDKIVWMDNRNDNCDIYLRTYDSVTGEIGPEVQITTDPGDQGRPAIYEDRIIWENYPEKVICMRTYDSDSNEMGPIIPIAFNANYPAIYQEKIAWVGKRDSSWDIDIYATALYLKPEIEHIEPTRAFSLLQITITGSNFGYTYDDSYVLFANGTTADIIEESSSNKQISCRVPLHARSGSVKVVTPGGESNGVYLEIAAPVRAPSNLKATYLSSSRIELTWQDNSDNETGFLVERSVDHSPFTVLRGVNEGVTTCIDTGLNNNTEYRYRVYAYNVIYDSTYSNIAIPNHPPLAGRVFAEGDVFESYAGEEKLIKTRFVDLDGQDDMKHLVLLISDRANNKKNCFYGAYNADLSQFFLRNKNDTAWLIPGQDGIIPANKEDNPYVELNRNRSSVRRLGNNIMEATWAVTFKTPFIGDHNIYTFIRDQKGAVSGLQPRGTWEVKGNSAPLAGRVFAEGNIFESYPYQEKLIKTRFVDLDGRGDMKHIHLLINDRISGTNCFFGYYDPVNDKFYMRNKDNKGAWLRPGPNGIIPENRRDNPYVELNCNRSSARPIGNNIIEVTWALSFTNEFIGDHNIYTFIRDKSHAVSGWQQSGTWKVKP